LRSPAAPSRSSVRAPSDAIICALVADMGNTVSGGFAVVQPKSVLSINAVEGYALEDFNVENVKAQLEEAQKVASGNGSEQDIAEAKIEIEVSLR